jgi:predicted Zn-dependent protease
VVGRHSANQLAAQYGLAVLTSVALGDNPEEIARMTEWFSAGAQAFFSRDDEREADEYGAKYLIAAGYDPRGLLTFFQKIKRLERGKRSGLDNLMASHPATEERIQRLEKMIWQAGSPKGRTEEERFARETAALRRGW